MILSFVVRRSSFVKDLFLCLLSAGLLIFSFPNFNFWLFAWFGFVPLFLAIQRKCKTKAFLLSYLTGVIFWLGIIYWLIHVTLPGMIILVLYLALYFGIFGLAISTIDYRLSTIDFFFIPSVWVLLEYVRAHLFTGFPWALLGYSQYLNLPFIQIADITGAWGVSFLVMMVNAAIYSAVCHRPSVTGMIRRYFIPLLCIIITFTYGYYKLNHRPSTIDHRPIKISIIQSNISQELKWEKSSRDFIMERYFSISSQALKDKPDLIIWPEAALPVVLEEELYYYERVRNFVKEAKAPLLFGAVTLRDNIYYNSALLISQEAQLLATYDKLHLVPFGEYIPLRKVFRFLETVVPIGDFSRGKEYTIFSFDKQIDSLSRYPVIPLSRSIGNGQTKFSVLICFEDLFPDLSREFVKRGAGFLINITNDAWFKKTSSPYQHLSASVFRAVENRVFLVRAANTGVSGFIAPTGRIISLVGDKFGDNTFIPGYKTQDIFVAKQANSFYTRYGNIFVTLCLLFVLGGIIVFIMKL
ncbi:MAG: apolipoprotein N-acyltransferase [Candidatus Omnitrophota bacterium]|nr:apolipoprotein N-acyltransferase [Candidatus Omnitrophota bacterium]